jgi:hypothetical protein
MHKKSKNRQIDLFNGRFAKGPLTKVCPRCQLEKPVTEFGIRSLDAPRPGAYCRPCQREYSRRHYQCNSTQHNQRRRANQKRYLRRNREMMNELLKSAECIDCGETDPVVLEFDHVRGKKKNNISDLVRNAFGWKRISDEISKCEIRCANCHRRRTAERFWRDKRLTGGSSAR